MTNTLVIVMDFMITNKNERSKKIRISVALRDPSLCSR